jgi:hypothetical protein
MAFEQYTRCVKPEDYVPRTLGLLIGRTLLLGPVAIGLALVSADPLCFVWAAEMLGIALVIVYCRNWLYERLICLDPEDQGVIGAVASVHGPSSALFDFDWDDDYGVNLLLENTAFGMTQPQAQAIQPYGYLIEPRPQITDPPVSRETEGYTTHDPGTGKETAALHCEFEGAGNFNLMQISEGMLAFAFAALLACVFLPFPANVIVSIGLGLAALLGMILGAIVSNYVRPGSPSDVDPDLGELHPNDEDNNGLGAGADIIYIEGTWVFDPLHEGWNEIHPVKVCTIVERGGWDGGWDTPPDVILRIRGAFGEARAEETQTAQAQPEHQWQVHPELDACAPDPIIT